MKFTISRTTAQALFDAANEVEVLGGVEPSHKLLSDEQLNEANVLANFAIEGKDGDITVEMNDEVLLKYLALYIKTARLVAPIVTAAIHMWSAVQGLIKDDCAELAAFITKRK